MIDSFRDTGRPLLSVLADADSIFIRALAQFKHRSLYANVLNDRTVTYYTAAISQTDPFVKPDALKINYLSGYKDVIIDPNAPVSAKVPEKLPAFTKRLTTGTRTAFQRAPIIAFLLVFIPIGSTLFLLNSVVQSVRSRQRIRLHEEGKAGIDIGGYRIPMFNSARKEVEDMFENMNNAQEQEYLAPGSEELASPTQASAPQLLRRMSSARTRPAEFVERGSMDDDKADLKVEFPTLALTQHQFKMIENLDTVGFTKFPVYIHKHRHTHAAIIRRMDKDGFEEGRVVVKHWLNSNFEL